MYNIFEARDFLTQSLLTFLGNTLSKVQQFQRTELSKICFFFFFFFAGVPQPGGLLGQVRETARHPGIHEERQVAAETLKKL